MPLENSLRERGCRPTPRSSCGTHAFGMTGHPSNSPLFDSSASGELHVDLLTCP